MPQAVERRQLNTQTVFYTLGLLEALRFVVGLKVPLSSQGISELLVALRRIQTFLLLPEISQAHQACISSVECRNGSHFSENSSTLSIDNTRAATHMTSKSQQSDSTNDFTEPVSPENLRLSGAILFNSKCYPSSVVILAQFYLLLFEMVIYVKHEIIHCWIFLKIKVKK